MEDRKRHALRPVVFYGLMAAVWILFSDLLVNTLVSDPLHRNLLNTGKGWVFVVVTGGLLYQWILREMAGSEKARERLIYLNQVLRARSDISQIIAREREPRDLFQQVCQTLVAVRNYRMAWVGLVEEGSTRVRPAAHAGFEDGYLERITVTWDAAETGRGPVGTAIRTRRPMVVRDVPGDPAFAPWREEATRRGYAAVAGLPMVYSGQVFGAIAVYAVSPAAFTDEEVGLLREMADDVAFALHVIASDQRREEAENLLRLQAARLEEIINYDSLTGLYNRQGFGRIIEREIATSRETGRSFCIVGFDLDSFDEINRAFGWEVGDQVLMLLAERLRRVAAFPGQVGRIGGDRFAIILPWGGDHECQELVGSVQAAVVDPITLDGTTIRLIPRGALINFPRNGTTRPDLEAVLHAAINDAVHRRADRLLTVDPEALSIDCSSLGWREAIQSALEEGRIEPVFQPLVELSGSQVRGFEVLARIRDGDILLEASTFIDEVETYGFLRKLDQAIFTAVIACHQHPILAGKRLFINFSPQLLGDAEHRRWLLDNLAVHPGLASRVVFEVTERKILGEMDRVLPFVAELKRLGVQLALDDFGTGYSSLSHFRHLPIDYVKIDGALIRGLPYSDLDRRLVASLHRLARDLGVVTLGEHVEDAATLEILRDIGVDIGQGYYLGRPESLEYLMRDPITPGSHHP